MSRANVEFDFFAMEKTRPCSSMDQSTSSRGIKLGAISRINPRLLRKVILSGTDEVRTPPPPRPTCFFPSPSPSPSLPSNTSMAPLTIFYNGTVAVFDLSHDKAEAVIKLAEEERSVGCYSGGRRLLAELNEELLPMARKRSLQRFLQKRKQRS